MKRFHLSRKLIIFLMVLLLFGILHFANLLAPVENIFLRITQSPQRFFYNLSQGFSGLYFNLTTPGNPAEEAQELKIRVHELMEENARLQILAQENESLKRQLNFFKSEDYKYISGRVISQERTGGLNFLMIDLGSQEGLKAGLPVLFQGVMVGQVVEVRERSSFVLPLVSSQARVAATVINEEKTKGFIQGENGLSFRLEMIPQNEEIKAGDLVVTSGLEEELPHGLIIAEVEEVSENKNELFKTARLKSLVNYRDVDIISVIVN